MTKQKRDQYLRGLLNGLPSAVVLASMPEGVIIYANPKALEYLHAASSDILGEPLGVLFSDSAQGRSVLADALKGRQAADLSASWRRTDGSNLSVFMSMSPATIKEEHFCFLQAVPALGHYCGYVTPKGCPGDDPHVLYRLLAENMAEVVWWLDIVNRRILYVSPSVYRLRGYTPEEVVGKSIDSIIAPSSMEHLNRVLPARVEAFLRKGKIEETYVDTLEMVRKDGGTIWTETTTRYLMGDGGRLEVIGVTRDITDRRVKEIATAEARATQEQTNLKLIQANAELERLATTDPLTGVWNRRRFLEELNLELGRFRRYGQPVSLLLMDLDFFKSVNDTLGHAVGDQVLMETAALLRSNLRAPDAVARWGGEEFAVLAVNTSLDRAATISEKLRNRIAEYPFPSGVKITASFGVAELCPGMELDGLLKKADDALYEAKAAGRNTVVASGG